MLLVMVIVVVVGGGIGSWIGHAAPMQGDGDGGGMVCCLVGTGRKSIVLKPGGMLLRMSRNVGCGSSSKKASYWFLFRIGFVLSGVISFLLVSVGVGDMDRVKSLKLEVLKEQVYRSLQDT